MIYLYNSVYKNVDIEYMFTCCGCLECLPGCPAIVAELGQVRINDDLVEPLAACQLGLAAGETQSRNAAVAPKRRTSGRLFLCGVKFKSF